MHADAVRARLKSFRKNKDPTFIREIFDRHATKPDSSAEPSMDAASLGHALQELGISGDAAAVLVDMDLDKDGRVDFEEFLSSLTLPSAAEAWAKRGAWSEIVAGAIMPCRWELPGAGHESALRSIAELSDEDVALAWQVIAVEMHAEYLARISELRSSFEQMDSTKQHEEEGGASAKFQTFKASAGSVDDFHKGLSGRVGASISQYRTPLETSP
jgi:hypothetical protein